MAERREDLRAADADRQFVADRLRNALNEGRLSLGEYDDRLKQAYAAKTYGDLDRLLGDLPTVTPAQHAQVAPVGPPRPPQPQAQPGPAPQQQSAGRGRMAGWMVGVWSAWLIAVLINVVIWVLVCLSAGQFVYFWPMWVAGPWGAVLLAISISGLARGDHRSGDSYQRYVERRTRRQMRHERRMRRYQDRWS